MSRRKQLRPKSLMTGNSPPRPSGVSNWSKSLLLELSAGSAKKESSQSISCMEEMQENERMARKRRCSLPIDTEWQSESSKFELKERANFRSDLSRSTENIQKWTIAEDEKRQISSSDLFGGRTDKIVGENGEYHCQLCPRRFVTVGSLQRHTLNDHSDLHKSKPPFERIYKCDHCERKFDTILSLHKHGFDEHHDEENGKQMQKQQRIDVPTLEQKQLACNHCDAIFFQLSDFAVHMNEHLPNLSRNGISESNGSACPICSVIFSSTFDTDRHLIDHFLVKDVRFSCEKCKESLYGSANDLCTHIIDYHAVKIYQCCICSKLFDSRDDIRKHSATSHRRKQVNWYCTTCNIRFYDYEQSIVHVEVVHMKRSLSIEPKNFHQFDNRISSTGREHDLSKWPTEAFPCHLCDQSFSVEFLFEKHIMSDHVTGIQQSRSTDKQLPDLMPIKCNVCDRQCSDTESLTEHKLIAHCRVARSDRCNTCHDSMTTIVQFHQHIQMHNNGDTGGVVNCVVCKQSLIGIVELEAHARFHMGACDEDMIAEKIPRRFACIKCQHTFETEEQVRGHVASHLMHDGFRHKCSLCDQIFNTSARLQCHLIEHSFEGCIEFRCYLCGVVFSMSQSLQQHMFTHSMDDRLYDCTDCSQKFFFQTELDNHKSSHSDGKQGNESSAKTESGSSIKSEHYTCPNCPKMFVSLSALQGHSHVHMSNRLHRCQSCGIGFNSRNKMKTHEKRHSEKTVYLQYS